MAALWVVVPAAGVGRRMGGDIPKQYLPLGGRTVIEQTLDRLLGHPRISGGAVALGAEDGWWPTLDYRSPKPLLTVTGGGERCHSVLNALDALGEVARETDWVLVHDAARPCLRRADMDRLIAALEGHPVGGILAAPVRDTVKRSGAGDEIVETVERSALWLAFTPQMFRLVDLRTALRAAIEGDRLVTDEASAMELAGFRPLLVEGHTDNIKITRPEDLPLAELYLSAQGEQTT